MKKRLVYNSVFGHSNFIRITIYSWFIMIGRMPCAILEVFLRRQMGERWFSLDTALIIVALLIGLPVGYGFWSSYGLGYALHQNPLWYLFVLLFAGFSVKRWLETRRPAHVYHLDKFTRDSGLVNPFLLSLYYKVYGNEEVPGRMFEIVFEPLPFALVGAVLLPFEPLLGILLIFSALCYSGTYLAGFYIADQGVLDDLDQMYYAKQAKKMLLHGKSAADTRNISVLFKRPKNEDDARQIIASTIDPKSDAIPVD